MADMLQLDKVTAGYGEAVVLNDVSFSLAEGETLALCAEQYFAQSEQTPTRIRLAVGQSDTGEGPTWRAGGLLIQNIAGDETRGERKVA